MSEIEIKCRVNPDDSFIITDNLDDFTLLAFHGNNELEIVFDIKDAEQLQEWLNKQLQKGGEDE